MYSNIVNCFSSVTISLQYGDVSHHFIICVAIGVCHYDRCQWTIFQNQYNAHV